MEHLEKWSLAPKVGGVAIKVAVLMPLMPCDLSNGPFAILLHLEHFRGELLKKNWKSLGKPLYSK